VKLLHVRHFLSIQASILTTTGKAS